jgi:hypothetical protein
VIANVPIKFRGKICMVCDTQATRFLNGYAYCDYHDPETYKKRREDAEAKVIAKTRIRKRTKKPLGVLKRKLDAAFGKMVMERDKGSLCVSCMNVPGTQPGHFMRRGLQATRWHPMNVHCQCFRCNCVENGNQLEYAETLDWENGSGTSLRLRQLAQTSYKPSREALESLLAAAKLGAAEYQEIWDFYGSEAKA